MIFQKADGIPHELLFSEKLLKEGKIETDLFTFDYKKQNWTANFPSLLELEPRLDEILESTVVLQNNIKTVFEERNIFKKVLEILWELSMSEIILIAIFILICLITLICRCSK